jgi:hypothetical protein
MFCERPSSEPIAIRRRVGGALRRELVVVYGVLTAVFTAFFSLVTPPSDAAWGSPVILGALWLSVCAVTLGVYPAWVGRRVEKIHAVGRRRAATLAMRLPLCSLLSVGVIVRLGGEGEGARLRWVFAMPEQVKGLRKGRAVTIVEACPAQGVRLGQIARCVAIRLPTQVDP